MTDRRARIIAAIFSAAVLAAAAARSLAAEPPAWLLTLQRTATDAGTDAGCELAERFGGAVVTRTPAACDTADAGPGAAWDLTGGPWPAACAAPDAGLCERLTATDAGLTWAPAPRGAWLAPGSYRGAGCAPTPSSVPASEPDEPVAPLNPRCGP